MDVFSEASSALSDETQNHSWIWARGANGSQFIGCDSTISEMAEGKSYHWSCKEDFPTDMVQLTIHLSAGLPWKGTFYVDNVRFE